MEDMENQLKNLLDPLQMNLGSEQIAVVGYVPLDTPLWQERLGAAMMVSREYPAPHSNLVVIEEEFEYY